MAKKNSKHTKKRINQSTKKSTKKSIKKHSKSMITKPKKKRSKYMPQAELIQKTKKKSVEFIQKHPMLEKAIEKTAEVERKYIKDIKTVGGQIKESAKNLFKSSPKQEEVIQLSKPVAAAETVFTEHKLKIGQGLYGRAVELPESFGFGKITIREDRLSGVSFEDQIKNRINEEIRAHPDSPLVNAKITVSEIPGERKMSILIERKEGQ